MENFEILNPYVCILKYFCVVCLDTSRRHNFSNFLVCLFIVSTWAGRIQEFLWGWAKI